MSWGWRATGGPTAGDTTNGQDWVSWWWTVRLRDGEPRQLEVRLSRTLVASVDGPDLPADLREAVTTKGRSEITRIALWEEPPNLILVQTAGRRRFGGWVARPQG